MVVGLLELDWLTNDRVRHLLSTNVRLHWTGLVVVSRLHHWLVIHWLDLHGRILKMRGLHRHLSLINCGVHQARCVCIVHLRHLDREGVSHKVGTATLNLKFLFLNLRLVNAFPAKRAISIFLEEADQLVVALFVDDVSWMTA